MRISDWSSDVCSSDLMTAHVDIDKPITAFRLMDGLNAKLRSQPVAILKAEVAADDFHARFSCVGRRYLYRIVNRRAPLALEVGRAWRVPVILDHEAMHEEGQSRGGGADFARVRAAHC